METPLVSVAMVVCNVERFLAEAIESILHQTFRDFEFIIVDFGSSDASPSIIRSYQEKDSRIQFHIIPPCNLSEARNDCCFRARGKYLALLDADDVALPDRLARQVEFLDSHPEIAILGGAVELIDETGRQFGASGEHQSDDELRRTLRNHSPFVVSSVTMRTEYFRASGGYRRPFAHTGEDYDLWLRMMERCRAATLAGVVARYRIHAGQMWGRNLKEQGIGQCVARASAAIRSRGEPDPLDSADSITPALLAKVGLAREQVDAHTLGAYCTCVVSAQRANVGAPALRLVGEMLEALSQSGFVRGPVAAETWLTAARAYWHVGDSKAAFTSLRKAIAARPRSIAALPWRGVCRVARKVRRWESALR